MSICWAQTAGPPVTKKRPPQAELLPDLFMRTLTLHLTISCMHRNFSEAKAVESINSVGERNEEGPIQRQPLNSIEMPMTLITSIHNIVLCLLE